MSPWAWVSVGAVAVLAVDLARWIARHISEARYAAEAMREPDDEELAAWRNMWPEHYPESETKKE